MRQPIHGSSSTSLIDTAQFRKLVQIDSPDGSEDRAPKADHRWNYSDDLLVKTDKFRKLEVPELAEDGDDTGFDPYNNADSSRSPP